MMEGNNIRWHQDDKREEEVEEEEYVLINLDAVTDLVNIPPNAPYVLSVIFLQPRSQTLIFILISILLNFMLSFSLCVCVVKLLD